MLYPGCESSEVKTVKDIRLLKSLPVPVRAGMTVQEAALEGRQQKHADVIDDANTRANVNKLLYKEDYPVVGLLAVEEDTSLWLYPGGCEPDGREFLVQVPKGHILVTFFLA